jgi:hypothetical protein
MNRQTISHLISAIFFSIAIWTMVIYGKQRFEVTLARSYIEIFQSIVERTQLREIQPNEAIAYIRNYYPAGSTLRRESEISRCVELSRNLAIKNIECRMNSRSIYRLESSPTVDPWDDSPEE